MNRLVENARIPVTLECAPEMQGAIQDVLSGEYETGYAQQSGEALTVLDIGANVGAFAIWASLRWPHCRVRCYEPHPGTFAMLSGNVADRLEIICCNAAVYPLEPGRAPFWARFDGDGEAGLVVEAKRTFERLEPDEIFEVPIVHPRDLPPCDVVKLDVEGAEAEILRAMNLANVSLVLLEFQNAENRAAIEALLQDDFCLVHQDSFLWDPLLPGSRYRRDLNGNRWGHLFFASRHHNRLWKEPGIMSRNPRQAAEVGCYPMHHKLLTRLKYVVKSAFGRIR